MDICKKQCFNTLTLFFVIFLAQIAMAQNEVLNISLEDAIDSALINNSKIQQFKQVVYQKEYLQKAAIGDFLPSIDVMGGYTYMSENPEVNMDLVKGSIDDVAGKYGEAIAKGLELPPEVQATIYNDVVGLMSKVPTYNIVIDQQQYPNLNITALQPIFLGGKVVAGKRFADAEYQYASTNLRKVSNEVIKETIETYFGVVLLKQVAETRGDVLLGMEKHEAQAKRAIEIGVIPPHELLRAQVAVAEARRELKDTENELALAILALKTTMGLSDTVNVNATDKLRYQEVPVNLSDLQNEAKGGQPLFGMIEQQRKMVDQKYALDMSEFMPQIAAWGEYGFFREEYPVIMPPAMVGVQAQINIFHGLKKFNQVKSSKFLQEEVDRADVYAHEQVSLWVESSYRGVLNSKEKYISMKPTVALASKNLEIIEKRFSEGMAKSIDVIDAQLLLEGVTVERLNSLYEYYISLSELYLATGNPDKIVQLINNKQNEN